MSRDMTTTEICIICAATCLICAVFVPGLLPVILPITGGLAYLKAVN